MNIFNLKALKNNTYQLKVVYQPPNTYLPTYTTLNNLN